MSSVPTARLAEGHGGRRGSRSDSMPAQPDPPVVPEARPSPPRAMTMPADVAPPSVRDWLPDRALLTPVVGLAAGGLLARGLFGDLHHRASGIGLGELMLVGAVVLLVVGLMLRRRAKTPPMAAVAVVPPPPAEPLPVVPTDLDRGVNAIRRADRGFDPGRFASYAAMMFRDVEGARMARDAGHLHDRLTPEMYAELLSFCEGLRTAGRSVRFDEVDVRAETTEAWQDGDRDYVTAYITGSMLSRTHEDATGHVVEGSRTTPITVEAFLTFTRPAGLNFWMLSIIQGA